MYESIRAAQNPLFIESLEEAVAALAPVVGGKKKLAAMLRPDLEDEGSAHKWLLGWLQNEGNPDRREVFHAIHLIRACRIAREHGAHFLKHWFDDYTGYERTNVAPPKTPEQEMADELTKLAANFKRVADDLSAKLAHAPNRLKSAS